MSIRLVCPRCRKQLAVPDATAGQMGQCPVCKTLFNVPASIQPKPLHASAPPPPRRTAVARPIPQPVLGEDAPTTGLTVLQKLAFAVVAAGVLAAAGFFVHRSMNADGPAPDDARQVVADATGKAPPPRDPALGAGLPTPSPAAVPERKPPVRITPADAPPLDDAAPEEDVGAKPPPLSRPPADPPQPKPPIVTTEAPPKPPMAPPPRDPALGAGLPTPPPAKPPGDPALGAGLPTPPPPETRPNLPVEPFRPGGANIYERLLKSTVMVLRPDESGTKAARGTGSFIHREQRLVLTNYHVVGDASEVFITFPIYQDGKLLVDSDAYMRKFLNKEFLRAKVVRVLKGQDLALVQLEKQPGAPVLRLASRSARPGEVVHSIGNPGASDAAWLYTKGEVRQVSHKKWKSTGGGGGNPSGGPGRGVPGGSNPGGGLPGGIPGGVPGGGMPAGDVLSFEADVLETTSPTNPGDSGGPLVNESGELVGVTQGANTKARSVSLFINVSEVRKILKEQGIDVEGGGGGEPSRPDNPAAEEVARGLNSTDAKVRAQAAARLADLGPDAKVALPALIRALNDPDRTVRKQAGNALLQIGTLERGDVRRSDIISLRACLRDESASGELQRYAIRALMLLGADAKAALPELGPLIKGEDKETRLVALAALEKLGPAARVVIADVAAALKSDDRFQNVRTALTLAKLDPDLQTEEGKAAVAVLIAVQKPQAVADLENKELIALVNDAAKALTTLGKPAVPAIRKAMLTGFKGGSALTGEDYANAVARLALVRIIEAMGPKVHSAELDRDLQWLEQRDPAAAVRDAAKQARAKIRPGK